jgi:hypothetical protein
MAFSARAFMLFHLKTILHGRIMANDFRTLQLNNFTSFYMQVPKKLILLAISKYTVPLIKLKNKWINSFLIVAFVLRLCLLVPICITVNLHARFLPLFLSFDPRDLLQQVLLPHSKLVPGKMHWATSSYTLTPGLNLPQRLALRGPHWSKIMRPFLLWGGLSISKQIIWFLFRSQFYNRSSLLVRNSRPFCIKLQLTPSGGQTFVL